MTNASTENNLPEITLDRVVAAMRTFGVAQLEICPWALREGLILRCMDRLGADPDAVDVQHAAPLAGAREVAFFPPMTGG